jgi:phosphomannomutase
VATNITEIKFGTDGWRALIAKDFTFANVRACAEGVVRLLREEGLASRGLVVGYDTRFGSKDFADEVARVSTVLGVTTYLCDRPTPTPVVSYSVLHHHAGGGIVITASHNPGAWNGFKYKPDYAGSATPEIVARLEKHIASAQHNGTEQTMHLSTAREQGLLVEFDPTSPYLENVGKSIDLEAIRQAGLRIAVDSMHGAGAGYLAQLLADGKSEVTEFRASVNPSFPGMAQPEPIAHNLEETANAVRQQGFDVALATDGDADRLGILDEHGEFITTLQTFALLCLHLLDIRGQQGPLIRSLTQSAMIDKLGALHGQPVTTTLVGFKYLGPVMMEQDALAAGEESGGYAFRGNIPERDGIFSGLLFLELMVRTGKRPSELVRWLYDIVGPHHYDRWDVALESGSQPPSREAILARVPKELGGLRVLDTSTEDGVHFLLESGFWGLVRTSGTEPLVRLYAEAGSEETVQQLLADLRTLANI